MCEAARETAASGVWDRGLQGVGEGGGAGARSGTGVVRGQGRRWRRQTIKWSCPGGEGLPTRPEEGRGRVRGAGSK